MISATAPGCRENLRPAPDHFPPPGSPARYPLFSFVFSTTGSSLASVRPTFDANIGSSQDHKDSRENTVNRLLITTLLTALAGPEVYVELRRRMDAPD